jgi:hypothetical protein
MLSFVMLNVAILSVVILNVVAPLKHIHKYKTRPKACVCVISFRLSQNCYFTEKSFIRSFTFCKFKVAQQVLLRIKIHLHLRFQRPISQ